MENFTVTLTRHGLVPSRHGNVSLLAWIPWVLIYKEYFQEWKLFIKQSLIPR
jgi:hypothetical protein